MKTLYVGNLPWSTTDEELSRAFSQFVQVKSCRIITDRETGRSRGFGFVEVDDADVQKAIDALSGTMLGGRQIVVNEARPRQPKF
ncbi:MAG TPA: RNA-binding protein [Firmicutes bacterium]|uniref:RNA-binding protein n=1 Tax=Candidatus Fermentithermobacillus carboniphilus TaxID=3085328 RepID=A0AAT9L9A5_9FIRM|nr:MAG: RNA-binding protein [Candidatus Fermentithermobacillus carboniphilus]HHW18240.1 RNA-binding protein [Candidatus Fermentithermobacillaceae bacterium]